jgi:hypothetical protein
VSARGWASFSFIQKATNTFVDVGTDLAVFILGGEVMFVKLGGAVSLGCLGWEVK